MRWFSFAPKSTPVAPHGRPTGPYRSVAFDFTDVPGPSQRRDGDWSAQAFREEVVLPALRQAIATGQVLTVNLDDTHGISASFLEHAFADLVTLEGFSPSDLIAHLQVEGQVAPGHMYARIARSYLAEVGVTWGEAVAAPKVA